MQKPLSHRDQLLQTLFETMDGAKRGLHAQMQTLQRDIPVPRAQLELLATVKLLQPISSKDIARHLYLTPGAVSQLVEGLEQHGFIARRIDPEDRRIQCLEVTKTGAALLTEVDKRRRQMLEAMLRGLSDEELEIWIRLQQKLIRQFQSEAMNQDQEKEQTT